jgi:hypothetical protein
MSRKTLLVLAMILTAGLVWAKPEFGADGRPLPPHLRHKQLQMQKQQLLSGKPQPGRPQIPERPDGMDPKRMDIVQRPTPNQFKTGPVPFRQGGKGLLKDDFLVNDDTSGYGANANYNPVTAWLSGGGTVTVWFDYSGGWNGIVWARIHDAASNPLGPQFMVGGFVPAGTYDPCVAATDSGFVITWCDYRSGNGDIYAQRYDAVGNALGDMFLVNDDGGSVEQNRPWIAANANGFVITWYDNRNGNTDIYAQRYDTAGNALGGNFLVNDGSNSQYCPSVAANDSGFVIAWYDYRNGNPDIYAQRYRANGDTVGGNFLVNDGSNDQFGPSVAANDSGFVIAWYDRRNGNWDIYAQRYSVDGNTLGGNFMVNDGVNDQYEASVAANDSGFVIAWYDYRNGTADIYAQRYNVNGDTIGGNFLVDDGSNAQVTPNIAAHDNGFAIVWRDSRDGGNDIYTQWYDAGGSALGVNSQVNNSDSKVDQGDGSVAMNTLGSSVVVWYDLRNDPGNWSLVDIYGQRYNSAAEPIGSNFLINDTTTAIHYGYDPRAVFLPGGGFVVTWYDYRNNWYTDIYAQIFDSVGNAVGSNFRVNDDVTEEFNHYNPNIAANDSGFMIVWSDSRNGGSDIYAQRYDTAGNAVGGNFKVDDGSSDQYGPSVAANDSGFVVVWYDYRNGSSDIYAQRYDAAGNAVGSNFMVSGGISDQYDPSVAASDSGFVVGWCDYRDGSGDIYVQFYKPNGDTIGGDLMLNDDGAGVNDHYYPSISLSPDNSKMMVAWEDYRSSPNVPEIMAQKCVNGAAEGDNIIINGSALANRYFWGGRKAVCNNQQILFTWDDNRRLEGMDIYAKLVDWDLKHIESESPEICYLDTLPDDTLETYGPYPVKAVVTDNQALMSVKLLYQVNGGAVDTLDMIFTSADTFEASIPQQFLIAGDSTQIGYWVTAQDSSLNTVASGVLDFEAIAPTGVNGQPGAASHNFCLMPASPNPSHGQTSIKYQLPKVLNVKLQLYNLAGQLVKTLDEGAKAAGYHQVVLNSNVLSNGIYFYRLQAGDFSATRKLLIVR